jgi:lysophospholipase L1-like esterase
MQTVLERLNDVFRHVFVRPYPSFRSGSGFRPIKQARSVRDQQHLGESLLPENVSEPAGNRWGKWSPLSGPKPVRLGGLTRNDFLSRSGRWLALGVVLFLAGELTTRLDDWLRLGVPFLAVPNQERDLILRDGRLARGRPHGRFKHWKLNEFGFRSPPMSREPEPDRPRILVLGASETFGFYESPGNEYPVRLQAYLAEHGNYEVVNAAITGITLNTMRAYWEGWLSQFHPRMVLIYPNPLFYLSDQPPGAARSAPLHIQATQEQKANPLRAFNVRSSRFLFRLKDQLHTPDFIQEWRDQRTIARARAQMPPDWVFRTLPAGRLELFRDDLVKLADAIRTSGAMPVLLTYAIQAENPPRPEDLRDLHNAQTHFPRANPDVILDFADAARRATMAVSKSHAIEVFNVAAALSGHYEYFGDLVHFNDAGTAALARLLGERILQMLPPPSGATNRP